MDYIKIGANRFTEHKDVATPQEKSTSIHSAIENNQPSQQDSLNNEARKTNKFFEFFIKLFSFFSKKMDAQSQEITPHFEIKKFKFKHIASGAAKAVYIAKPKRASAEEAKSVYYIPIKGIFEKIFGRKKAEIQEEVKTAANIQKVLNEKGLTGEINIATDLKEVEGSDNLLGEYVVKAPKAGDDGKNINLDALLKNPEIPLNERFALGAQILNGLKNLHEAGYVHGDLKGDNILHYRETQSNGKVKSILRLADFGKTRLVKENQSILHTGNPRYAAPEGRSSQKSEVFSAALLLIRILEEEVLEDGQDMIMTPARVKEDQKGENLRGVEKFVVINDQCSQTNNKNFQGKVRLIAGAARAIRESTGAIEKNTSLEVKHYIYELFNKLKEGKNSDQINSLNEMQALLIMMVNEEPSKRPSMAESLVKFEEATQHYEGF